MDTTKVCNKCNFPTWSQHDLCAKCEDLRCNYGDNVNYKGENVMKWTKKTEQKMLAIISNHKKLQDGFIDAADKLNISKSAVTNRYYRMMKAKSNDALEPSKSIMIDKQKIGRALRKVDEKPPIIYMVNDDYTRNFDKAINPPTSCDAGSVNYTNKPKIEKPKSFIEKVLAFFKGGKDE